MSTHELTVLIIALTSLLLSCTNLIRMMRESRQRRLNRPRCSVCGKQTILFALESNIADDPDTGDPDLYCESCLENVKEWLQGLKDNPNRR